MNKFELSSSYYLVFENLDCVQQSLPDGVFYDQHNLTFDNKEPLEIQIVYFLDENVDVSLHYQFKKNTQVHIIESKFLKKNASLHKILNLEENANVRIFQENQTNVNEKASYEDKVYLQRDASCHCGYAELSEGDIEAHYHYYLDGENAEAKIRMAVLSQEKQNKHYEILIQHNQPHTLGQMDNYGVVKDLGRLVLDGIGTITKGQHGSEAHQTNKIMVFDPDCVASANPYLFIDEFDVKASHAAGVGKMDEEHLYYLQSRGLSKKQAMQLITYGYLKPVIEVIDNEMMKEHFEKVLSKVGA